MQRYDNFSNYPSKLAIIFSEKGSFFEGEGQPVLCGKCRAKQAGLTQSKGRAWGVRCKVALQNKFIQGRRQEEMYNYYYK
jgi:hypothetical protein